MKRFFALILIVCLLLTPVGALTFTDRDAVRNLDAVTLMANLGLVQGYEDNTFRPRNNIRRAEAAKVAALICEKTPKAQKAVTFSDVEKNHWAASYVAYCAEKGFISGMGGLFRPADFVTGREFAKLMLGCLGYDGSRYVGKDWASKVDADAKKLGIYKDFTADPAAIISRDDACLLMYNAMQCYAVTGKNADGSDIYALDQLMNPITYMEHRFGVVKFSGVLEANEYADLTEGGRLEAGASRLEGHNPLAVTTPYEFLGRTVELYTLHDLVNGENYYTVLGIPHVADADEVFTVFSEDSYLMALRYAGLTADEKTRYYLDGKATESDFLARLEKDCTITGVDRDGDKHLDAVLATNFSTGIVLSTEPLIVACGDRTGSATFFAEERPLQVGQTVRCAFVGGRFCIADDLG